MGLSQPAYGMLRYLAGCDDACAKAEVPPKPFWSICGLGGKRVAGPLSKKGLVVLGHTECGGYQAAKITPEGREALVEEKHG